jgi:TRAP transporter TAXI family solute receptor
MLGRGDHGDHRYGLQAVSVALAPTPVTLATGTPGGIYHPVGNAICRMFNLPDEHQAKPCVAVSSGGSVENIRRIESGGSTFGLSQTDVAYAAFHGEGPFAAAGPDPKLRMLIALYPEAFTVVARADTGIRDFQDLRDKRVGIGKSGAGYTFTRDVVVASYGGGDIGSRASTGARDGRAEPGTLQQQGRCDHIPSGASQWPDPGGDDGLPGEAGARRWSADR